MIDEDGATPWIVPALPRHLVYEWLAARLREQGVFKPCAVPEKVIPQLPNTFKGPEGQVYMSNADFICPENCNEPKHKCPVTGKPRPYRLYDHLARIESGSYRSLVVRSFQLAPGVGGYRGETANGDTVRSPKPTREISCEHRQQMSRCDARF